MATDPSTNVRSDDPRVTPERAPFDLSWQDTPTLFADVAMGFAQLNGVLRITLGTLEFNPEPNAQSPICKSVFKLAMTNASAIALANEIYRILDVPQAPADA